MAVFRVEKTKDFTIMSNHHLRNTELSLKAKGLLSLMLSLPEDWDYTTKGLAHICKDGVDSITTALKELERHGYLTRQRLRYDNGQLGDMAIRLKDWNRPKRNMPPPRFRRAVFLHPKTGRSLPSWGSSLWQKLRKKRQPLPVRQ